MRACLQLAGWHATQCVLVPGLMQTFARVLVAFDIEGSEEREEAGGSDAGSEESEPGAMESGDDKDVSEEEEEDNDSEYLSLPHPPSLSLSLSRSLSLSLSLPLSLSPFAPLWLSHASHLIAEAHAHTHSNAHTQMQPTQRSKAAQRGVPTQCCMPTQHRVARLTSLVLLCLALPCSALLCSALPCCALVLGGLPGLSI